VYFKTRKGRIEIDLSPLLLSTGILIWALYYYFSTVRTPDGGAESVLFIRPLTIFLAVCFPFVVRGCIRVIVHDKVIIETKPQADKNDKDRGFLDKRRLFFTLSLFVYTIGLTFLGYFIPSVLFVSSVCFYLGVRNLWLLIGLPIFLAAFVSVVFKGLIHVPVPIWPW